ncbi:MAG TPA: 2-phospho-L-lactate transferase [Anaerolineae bacterium]|nr:2-phospho-L-lactate transferase [Anaerolineae bacterium]
MTGADKFTNAQVVVLAGGVGGAKLTTGLAAIIPPENLTIVVNTGDDFVHCGLTICPDLDTVTYNLAQIHNVETGWGRHNESWRAISTAAELGGPDWFRLGDLDLGTHLARTHALEQGQSLTAVTRQITSHLGIQHTILPMCDQPAPTIIATDDGDLPFQTWFVRHRWQPTANHIKLPDDARANAQLINTLQKADIIILAPSNPFVSIDPILNVYPIRSLIMDVPQAVIAVSPIINGQAVKGPAAKLMADKGLPVTSAAIADYYQDLLDGFVYDQQDSNLTFANPDLATLATQTLMTDSTSRQQLAREVMQFAQQWL